MFLHKRIYQLTCVAHMLRTKPSYWRYVHDSLIFLVLYACYIGLFSAGAVIKSPL